MIPLLLLCAAGCVGSAAPEPDPARFVPDSMTAVVEWDHLSADARQWLASPVWKLFPKPEIREFPVLLKQVADAGIGRAFLAADYQFVRNQARWVLLLQCADPSKVEAELMRLQAAYAEVALIHVGPFVGIADSRETAVSVATVASGEADALLEVPSFQNFRQHPLPGSVRFHVDLNRLLPIRPTSGGPENAGAAFFAAHLLAVGDRAQSIHGALDSAQGVALRVQAETAPMPTSVASLRPGSNPPPLLAPTETPLARLSLHRNLAEFWQGVRALVPDSERPALAEFQNNLSLLLGGMALEDFFAGLGPALDLYVWPAAAGTGARHPFPTAALVIPVADIRLAGELMITFQETIGAVNLQASQDGTPRYLMRTETVGATELCSASFLPDHLPSPDDDRRQLQPTFACAHGFVFLGTHPRAVRPLLDAAEKGQHRDRDRGDTLTADLAGARPVVEALRSWLRARLLLSSGNDDADTSLDAISSALNWCQELNIQLSFDDRQSLLDIALIAPKLWSTEEKR